MLWHYCGPAAVGPALAASLLAVWRHAAGVSALPLQYPAPIPPHSPNTNASLMPRQLKSGSCTVTSSRSSSKRSRSGPNGTASG